MASRPGISIPAWRDIEVARALMARLYREHEAGNRMGCHATAIEVTRYLRLIRIIVPQHRLWTVNPYRRCDFRCTYCSVYARGSAVPVLTGEALRRRLRLELGVVPPDHHVALSSMCDAYVPAEAQLGVARLAIEELLAAGHCVHVVTKGVTVLRDADLLRRARCGKVEVSLCTLDDEIAAELEPGAPSPAERLALVRALAGAGVDVGIMVAPWIPGVTDMGAILAAAGSERRITISPLKCNAPGAQIELAGRTHRQQVVDRRYREERDRFRGVASLRWEAPWQIGEHYGPRYLPLTFEEVGIIQSPAPPPDRAERAEADRVTPDLAAHRPGSRGTLSDDRRPDRPPCRVDDAPSADDTRPSFGKAPHGAARLRRGWLGLGGRRVEWRRRSRSRVAAQPARRTGRDGAGARNPGRRSGARTLPAAGDPALDDDEDGQSPRRALRAHDRPPPAHRRAGAAS
jgi:DNA repair photolyase